MAQDLELALRIRADLQQASKELRGLREDLQRMGGGGKRAQSDLRGMNREIDQSEQRLRRAGVAGRQFGRLMASLGAVFSARKIVQATRRQDEALAQVEARVRSTGGAAGYTTRQLAEMAAGMQQATTYGDEAVLEMQSLLLTFTQVQGDVFRDSQELILDVATAMGTDLKSAALQVGKALNDPVRGLDALSRSGIQFSAQQKETIKGLVETGRTADAQRMILAELERQFGGAARAARDTFGGALDALGNAFGDLLESKGGLNDSKEAIEDLTRLLQDPSTAAAVDNITAAVVRGLGKLAEFTAAVHFLVVGTSDEVEQINQQVGDIDRSLSSLREALSAPRALRGTFATKGGLFGEEGLLESDESILRRINELEAERARLIARQTAIFDQRGKKPRKERANAGAPGGAPTAGAGAAPPSKDFLAAQADLERRIALLGQEGAAQQMLWEVEQGRYSGLEAGEKAALVALARRLDAGQAGIRQAEEQARALEEARAEQEAYDAELEQAARALRDVLDPVEPLRRELAQLDELLARGKLSWDEWAEGTLRVHERMDELNGALDDAATEASEFALQAARGIQDVMTDYLFDPFDEGLGGMLQGFADMVRRMIAEALAAQLAEKLFGDFSSTGELGGWIGSLMGSLFHTGGVAGEAAPGRSLPELAYLGAPRYHGGGIAGLAPDEIPAILRRGEEVLTADDPRHVANGGASAAAPQTLQVAVHPDALRMTLGEWLEGELARVVATR